MKTRAVAVIDVGSNTIRSLVVGVDKDGNRRVLDDEKEVVRLASGLTSRGRLSDRAMRRALVTLGRLAAIARERGARRFAVVGTSAIRVAANRHAFVDRVRAETGLQLRVVSESEEARLAFESAAHSFDLGDQPCVVVDIGGGSTEIVLALGHHVQQDHSLRLGAVSLTEEVEFSDPVRRREFRRLRRVVRRRLRAARLRADPPPRVMIASGGTATSLAQIAMARQGLQGRPAHGFEMTQAELLHLLNALMRRTLAERRQMPGLSPDRADIIIAGAAILYEVMARLKVNNLRVNGRGIRHALLERMLRPGHAAAAAPARRRLAAAEDLGRSLRYEESHGRQVRRLSERIFDQLAGPVNLDPGARDLLSAAALLHDVGYVVSYRGHHKHTYRLLSHAQLEGFTPREREIIALAARFHRRGGPRAKNRAWASLPRDDRRLVTRLAAIVRLADALDRRHSRRVLDVRCHVTPTRLVVTLVADGDLAVERHAVEEKSDLLAAVLEREVVYRTERPAAATLRPGPSPAAGSARAPRRRRRANGAAPPRPRGKARPGRARAPRRARAGGASTSRRRAERAP
jgi:exopolyphosphatase / guanosine-5'-triphosphate,3'-diphosphate pyrophosphatase